MAEERNRQAIKRRRLSMTFAEINIVSVAHAAKTKCNCEPQLCRNWNRNRKHEISEAQDFWDFTVNFTDCILSPSGFVFLHQVKRNDRSM